MKQVYRNNMEYKIIIIKNDNKNLFRTFGLDILTK